MAALKSTASKTRSRQDRRARQTPSQTSCPLALAHLQEAVDSERMRLMKAHSLLQCIALALESAGAGKPVGASGPYFPDVVDLASELVRESINRLDPVLLRIESQRRL